MHVSKRAGSPYYWYDFSFAGRRYRNSTKETNKQAAIIVAQKTLEAIKRQPPRYRYWNLSQIIGTWWTEHAQHKPSANAIWSNIQNLERCLDIMMPASALTNSHLMDFRARRRNEGVQPPTINRDLAYLQAACRHCALIHKQPEPDVSWSRLKYPENPARVRFAGDDEFARLLAAADDDLADIILFAALTGLRRGNVLPLQWHQIDMAGGSLTVPTTKAKIPIIIRLPVQILEILRKRRAAAARETGGIPRGNVFNATNWRRRWTAARRDAEMVDFRWHDLRHTFATWARKSGVDLPTLKMAMAHKDIKTTERYAHVTADEANSTFDKVGARLAQSTAQIKTSSIKTVV